jgi:nucleoid-associated protein YgaU
VIESVLAPPDGKTDKAGTVEMEMRPGTTELAAMGAALRNTLMGIGPGVGNILKPGPAGGVAPPTPSGLDPIPAPPPTPKVTLYKVEAGDTLIKIARKVYGGDNWRMYKQIFEANRKAMDDDETALTVGQELVLPVRPADKPGAVPAPAAGAAGGARDAIADAGRAAGAGGAIGGDGGAGRVTEMGLGELGKRFGAGTDATAGRSQRAYVVQRGDSLTTIARKVLNDDSPAAVKKIYNANKDRLPAPNRLSVGMQLQIPS